MASKSDDKDKPSNKLAEPNKTPGKVDKDDPRADASVKDLSKAANVGAEAKRPPKDHPVHDEHPGRGKGPKPKVKPLKEGEHLPGADFRGRVENTAAGDLDMDPREPYPTGNPPDQRESFHRIHGYYPPDESGEKDAQAKQMDADPKT